ncbi:uncharacterized protein B0I36DRAFT_352266 [Microdochium trichocladiopsis]|uniref:Uncharacterized protein n=1 Tax=Microdochium trichocladiopsis TaxID=1682393 RepID=A0A9P8Y095_9PEZI|nr:uncharacterized protein B0I36DRAFT_352266 [Microdochium trichocladiopsis]KAH7026402.1 hypothetical protein B0I36DRAFT_352266 [Microdochium trichocladiopsis]
MSIWTLRMGSGVVLPGCAPACSPAKPELEAAAVKCLLRDESVMWVRADEAQTGQGLAGGRGFDKEGKVCAGQVAAGADVPLAALPAARPCSVGCLEWAGDVVGRPCLPLGAAAPLLKRRSSPCMSPAATFLCC